jgi:TolA-binding protein
VLEKYHDTKYAEPALLKKAESLSYRKKYKDAKEALEKFLLKYPSSTLRFDANKLYSEVTTKMNEVKIEKKKTL